MTPTLTRILFLLMAIATYRSSAWGATKSISLNHNSAEYLIEKLSSTEDSGIINYMNRYSIRCEITAHQGMIFKSPPRGEYFRLQYIKDHRAWHCIDAGDFFYLRILLRKKIEQPATILRLVDTTLFHLSTDSICGRPIPSQHTKFAQKLRDNPQIVLDSIDCSQHGFAFTENGRTFFYPIQGRAIRLDTFLKEKEYSLWSDSTCSYAMEFRSRRIHSICGNKIRRNGIFMPRTHFGYSGYSWDLQAFPLRNGQYRSYIKCLSGMINTPATTNILDTLSCIGYECESTHLGIFDRDSSPFRLYCPSPTGVDSFRIYRDPKLDRFHNLVIHLGTESESSP